MKRTTRTAAALVAIAALAIMGASKPTPAAAPEPAAPTLVYMPMIYKPAPAVYRPAVAIHDPVNAPVPAHDLPAPYTPPEPVYIDPPILPTVEPTPAPVPACGQYSTPGPHPCRAADGQDNNRAPAAPGGPADVTPPAHRQGDK